MFHHFSHDHGGILLVDSQIRKVWYGASCHRYADISNVVSDKFISSHIFMIFMTIVTSDYVAINFVNSNISVCEPPPPAAGFYSH